jgi:CubicO group peptidase (beta-lactamase class C family)
MNRDAVTQVLQAARARRMLSGAAAAVVDEDGVRGRVVVGHRFNVDDSGLVGDVDCVVDDNSAFDLASLTKLLCTTVLVADAVDDGDLSLDEEPFFGWPGATVARLLAHCAGVPAHKNFFQTAITRGVSGRRAGFDLVRDLVLATPPEARAGTQTVYSDLGFIALGHLLEERTGDPLDVLLRAAWAKRAAASTTATSASASASTSTTAAATPDLSFVRLWVDGFHPRVPNVVATERCPWRKRALHGQVHDDNCFTMGGMSGHAGLFGSIVDVEAAAVLLLRELRRPSTLRTFALARPDGLGRALGFDVATAGGAAGDVLSPFTVGHLGFTGTSLWFDVDAGRAYVLLANTVHPSRENVRPKNLALRRAFHRAAVVGDVDVDAFAAFDTAAVVGASP